MIYQFSKLLYQYRIVERRVRQEKDRTRIQSQWEKKSLYHEVTRRNKGWFILQNQKWVVGAKFTLILSATKFAFKPAKHFANHNRWFYM